jgi:hypothetical protein
MGLNRFSTASCTVTSWERELVTGGSRSQSEKRTRVIFWLLLGKRGRKAHPTLYDLILREKEGKEERVNYHAIQIVRSTRRGCKFIHLTDIHSAKKNDEILDEALTLKRERPRGQWEDWRPVIVQTAAFGLNGRYDEIPLTIGRSLLTTKGISCISGQETERDWWISKEALKQSQQYFRRKT